MPHSLTMACALPSWVPNGPFRGYQCTVRKAGQNVSRRHILWGREQETIQRCPAFQEIAGSTGRARGQPDKWPSTPPHDTGRPSVQGATASPQSHLIWPPPPDRALQRALTPVIPLCYRQRVPSVCCSGMPRSLAEITRSSQARVFRNQAKIRHDDRLKRALHNITPQSR